MTASDSYREIPLTRGKVALVDEEDFESISAHKWWVLPTKSGFYAGRTSSDGKTILMHREITGFSAPHTDHINHDTLDNRKVNLRPCTEKQNQGNRKKNADNTSGYRGVHKYIKGWRVKIAGRTVAYCKTAEEGAKIYDQHAIAYFGEFAHLNFPAL